MFSLGILQHPLLRYSVIVNEANPWIVGAYLVMLFLMAWVTGKSKYLKVIIISVTLEIEKMA